MICEGWEGLTVDGRFPLLEWLGGWADRCVFLTVRQSTHTANIKLIQASGADADACVAKWEAAKALPHPCLVEMMETGHYRLGDTDVAYVVTEKADTFLSGIIPRKALDAAKAKEILSPVVDALAFVHESGYVHGSVKPSSIALIGDHWKLSSDEMARAGDPLKLNRELDTYDAPEAGGSTVTSAADMWSLGMIVVEACSQRTPVWDRNTAGDLGVPDWLPQPFGEIARECVRWDPVARMSITQVKDLLARTPIAESAIAGSSAAREPKVHSVAAAAAIATDAPVSKLSDRVAAVRAEEPGELRPPARGTFERETDELTPRSPRLFADIAEDEERPSRTGPLLFAILALLVIGVVLGIRYRSRIRPLIAKQNAPSSSQQTPQTEAPQNPAGAVKPDQDTTPSATQSAPAPNQTSPPATGTRSQAAEPPAETAKTPSQEAGSQDAGETNQAKSAPQSEEKAPPESETPASPRVMNAKGAVLKRVLPNVAPGAFQSMRRPVQVDVRVSVDDSGAVSSAQCVTQSRGNYWAKVSQQAAESWKFKAPVSEGHTQTSYWMLLFEYNRGHTDVVAKQLR
ncbi:MAG: hypothetical protein JST28_12085 [Acidobacteria bacterium]|nr:hypothetical protein [Acidobacteriota bacterium]